MNVVPSGEACPFETQQRENDPLHRERFVFEQEWERVELWRRVGEGQPLNIIRSHQEQRQCVKSDSCSEHQRCDQDRPYPN